MPATTTTTTKATTQLLKEKGIDLQKTKDTKRYICLQKRDPKPLQLGAAKSTTRVAPGRRGDYGEGAVGCGFCPCSNDMVQFPMIWLKSVYSKFLYMSLANDLWNLNQFGSAALVQQPDIRRKDHVHGFWG